jgi:hypothetical protein
MSSEGKSRSGCRAKGKKSPRSKLTKNLQAHLNRIQLGDPRVANPPDLTIDQLKAYAKTARAIATRRDVLKSGAAVAGAAALPGGLLASALAAAAGRKTPPGQSTVVTEPRNFLFNLGFADSPDHRMVLAQGRNFHPIKRVTPAKLKKLRKQHPVLELVPDSRITHYLDVDMPANSPQLCYVQRFHKHSKDGSWSMPMMFTHHPTSALHFAARKELERLAEGEAPRVPGKWKRHGLTGEMLAALADPVGLDVLKDSNDTATTMISGHPEMMCIDPNNSAYIQTYVSGPNSEDLAGNIEFQGAADPQANWAGCGTPFQANTTGYATLQPVCNPDTGEQARISATGDLMYIPVYSDQTNSSLNSDGMMPSLLSAKQDTSLGANISSNSDPTQGLIWRTEDGVTTSAQTSDSLGLNAELSYTTRDFSPGHGYSVSIEDVEDDPSDPKVQAVIKVRVTNWFVRYLGLYVRYLDADGVTLKLQDVIDDIGKDTFDSYYEFHEASPYYDTETDVFVDMLAPEFELYGMPIAQTDKVFSIPMPEKAASAVVLANGMGASNSSSNPFKSPSSVGATMTGIVCLGLTMFFLTLQAAEGVAPFIESLEENENALKIVPLIIELFVNLMEAVDFNDPAAFIGLAVEIGNTLLKSGSSALVTYVTEFIAEAETAQDVLDTIPIFGLMYSAIIAIGTLAQLAQSATDVLTSPSTYAYEVTLTHDIVVTVRPNLSPPPDGDPDGWPATATHFDVIAQFDGGTPTSVRGELPPIQTTDPQTVTFQSVPLGGRVTLSVGVYSENDFLVGNASAGPMDNVEGLAPDITFKEILVPLDATTVYSHNAVTELDATGKHVWTATKTAPLQAQPGCSPSNGQLCRLVGITVNSASGDIGQTFQSYNNAVPNCGNPNSFSNGYQFSNISSTQDPESAFFFTGCTFSSAPRLVYDLLNRNNANFYLDTVSRGPNYVSVVRQVRLNDAANPGFDEPGSNLAWGRLQHPSDALLLHPGGKIISISNTKNKFEVIDLPDAAGPDADSPISQSYSARGLRPGLMDGPVLAALDPDGTILVLESGNKRIQAFDINGNAAPIFPGGAYFIPLKDQPVSEYLDFTIEFKGYMFVLSIVSGVYTLDIYTPTGEWLAATSGFAAQKLAVNYWRDIFAQNAHILTLPNGALPARTEPAISHWIPSTP